MIPFFKELVGFAFFLRSITTGAASCAVEVSAGGHVWTGNHVVVSARIPVEKGFPAVLTVASRIHRPAAAASRRVVVLDWLFSPVPETRFWIIHLIAQWVYPSDVPSDPP